MLFGIKNETSDKITVLDKSTYADKIKENKVQLVDVRTSEEYQSGHIKKPANIDAMNAVNFERAFRKFDKNKPVYLYCRSGARSQKAASKLVNMGFSKIYDLQGGYMNWIR